MTYYKRTVQQGQGGGSYVYTALGTAKPKVGEVLVIVWDFSANPQASDAIRWGAGRMDYARTKDSSGHVIDGTNQYPGDNGSREGISVPQPVISLGETKKIRVEFTPTYSGTYSLTFRTEETPDYASYWDQARGRVWQYIVQFTFTPSFDVVVDP